MKELEQYLLDQREDYMELIRECDKLTPPTHAISEYYGIVTGIDIALIELDNIRKRREVNEL